MLVKVLYVSFIDAFFKKKYLGDSHRPVAPGQTRAPVVLPVLPAHRERLRAAELLPTPVAFFAGPVTGDFLRKRNYIKYLKKSIGK